MSFLHRLGERLRADRHLSALELVRWLGPWAGARTVPAGVVRHEERLAGAVRSYLYEPAAPRGVYLVAPGLHYAGPDDERLDRFCRVLARAGYLVVAPFLDDFLLLRVAPGAGDQLAVAADHALAIARERSLPAPALFSISFGCMPALAVATSERHRDALGALVLFGAYRDFFATIRFAVTARAFRGHEKLSLPHDPLNVPAVFVNLLPLLDAPEPRAALARAWLTMAQRTWGRPELRPVGRREPIAETIAAELAPAQRELFLIGCGLRPGAGEHLEAGLATAHEHFAFADPAPRLAALRMPVVIAHGADDDVIPWVEAEKLRDALPSGHPHRYLLTGMYGHTGSALPAPAEAARELQRMLAMVYALVDAPRTLTAES